MAPCNLMSPWPWPIGTKLSMSLMQEMVEYLDLNAHLTLNKINNHLTYK